MKETEMEAQAETETAVEAQAEAETVVETQEEMEVRESSDGTGNSAVQTGDSSRRCLYMGTLLLAAAAFVFGFRRRNQEK
ncbi:MAG: hypothetical protein ACLU6F_12280 [[Ruminococcus] torques]